MTDWTTLLELLGSAPRENGSAALHQTALQLQELLRSLGLDASLIPYTAQPLRLRLAGVIVLMGSLIYALLLRRGRPRAALALATALPLLILADLDFYIPVFGWIGSAPSEHVEAVIPGIEPQRHLILAAHFDSKTDLLDHLQRAPIELLALPISVLMIIAAAFSRRPRLRTTAVVLAPLYGIATFLSLSGGALVSTRSHGALDDGAACAILVRLGERLVANPPAHTKVTLLFLSGEETGVYGSWVYAESRFDQPPAIPTAVINLEFLGAAADLGVFGKETYSVARYSPDPTLLAAADAVHLQQRGKPIYVSWYGAATDARSFLAHGVPALTLFSDLPEHAFPRDLHSASDTIARVQPAALDSTLDFLEAMVRRL